MRDSSTAPMNANQALWLGIAFSIAFTGLIWVVRPILPQVAFLEDFGASWYYWQLPEPTLGGRLTAWSFYLAHQFFSWGTIYVAQRSGLKYTAGLHRINLISMVGTAGFIFLHLVQTAVWYDGLAQDVSIWTSQWSVIIMLVLILHLENQRRGIFFGHKLKFLTETGRVVRKYHGYIFSWGIIYTFWYHPMENTFGHLMGFLYIFLLLVQSNTMYTRAHLNKYWTFALEFLVLVHATLVALGQGPGVWRLFFFGFAGLFIVTQMHGIGLKTWQRWGFLAAYAVGALVAYGTTDMTEIWMVTLIPFTEYAAMFVFAALIWIGMKAVSLFQSGSGVSGQA